MAGLEDWQHLPTALPPADAQPLPAAFFSVVVAGTESRDLVHISAIVFGSDHAGRLLALAVVAILSAVTVWSLLVYLAVSRGRSLLYPTL